MGAQQLSTQSLLGQGRNKERNERLPRIQWKLMHNVPKFMGHNEGSSKRIFVALRFSIKKIWAIWY